MSLDWSLLTIDQLLAGLELEVLGPDHYRAHHLEVGGDVVFGGQLLGQAIVAAGTDTDLAVKTVHTTFARGVRRDEPIDILVDRFHAGRTFASSTVTMTQGDRPCVRSQILLSAEEPDFIRHGVDMGEVADPETAAPGPEASPGWEVRFVVDVDIVDPAEVGPACLDVWTRFPGAPEDRGRAQALLAFATDGFLIGTAMRPHEGVGQAQAHVTVATSVVSHTLTFHEPVRAGEWMLLRHEVPYAGRGRSYGRANVFDSSGQIVASFVQDAMIRAMPTA